MITFCLGVSLLLAVAAPLGAQAPLAGRVWVFHSIYDYPQEEHQSILGAIYALWAEIKEGWQGETEELAQLIPFFYELGSEQREEVAKRAGQMCQGAEVDITSLLDILHEVARDHCSS